MSDWFSRNRQRYPADWDALSRAVREEAGWRCENCGAENGQPHPTNGKRTVLTTAHIDAVVDGVEISRHDKSHRHRAALRCLRAPCHLSLDREDHIRNAAETRRQRKIAAGQLPLLSWDVS